MLIKAISHFGIDIVYDVGANAGYFAKDIRAAGFSGDIVSFEPLSEAHAALELAARKDKRWKVHPRAALGSTTGETSIHISKNSVSSSLLAMSQSHIDASPGSVIAASEAVSVCTLDSVYQRYLSGDSTSFLKIDTQGYEMQILEGACKCLPQIRGILLEVSFVELYEGQHLWKELLEYLEVAGFELWSLDPGFRDMRTGRLLQADALFFRDVGLGK